MTVFEDDVLSFKEAKRRLRVSQPVFNGLLRSRLLGNYYQEGYVLVAGVEHYERYGTQWITEDRDDVEERMLTAEFLENRPQPPDSGEGEQSVVQSRLYIISDSTPDLEEANAMDMGWLAHFYLTPNTFFFPAPTTFGMIGAQLLKLGTPSKVPGAELPA